MYSKEAQPPRDNRHVGGAPVGAPCVVSLPISRILFSGIASAAGVCRMANSNLFGEAEEATIHLGPALPRDLGAAYLGLDLRLGAVRAGHP